MAEQVNVNEGVGAVESLHIPPELMPLLISDDVGHTARRYLLPYSHTHIHLV